MLIVYMATHFSADTNEQTCPQPLQWSANSNLPAPLNKGSLTLTSPTLKLAARISLLHTASSASFLTATKNSIHMCKYIKFCFHCELIKNFYSPLQKQRKSSQFHVHTAVQQKMECLSTLPSLLQEVFIKIINY